MFLTGPAFQRGVTLTTPSGNIDVTPTVLSLLGLPTTDTEGRVLSEALARSANINSTHAKTDTLFATTSTSHGTYRSALQVTTFDGKTYIDQAWRVR
jgi:hypothetical protein